MTTTDRLIKSLPSELFIGGRWTPGDDNRTLTVHNPATGEALKTIADASPYDGLRALEAADAAAEQWAATSPRFRSDILRSVFDLLRARSEDAASIMTAEMGKPLAESRSEVQYGGEFLRWFSEEAVRTAGRSMPSPEGTGQMLISYLPVGPCYLITPWNFPLAMATRKIAPALAAGCTVVIKPAEQTPLTTLFLASIFEEAGLPPGILNVITTSRSRAVSEPIIEDPRLRKLSFTGSTAVGQTLISQAAKNVLRVSMELGGNAPFLVFADADLDKAVDGAMAAKFRNIGQACTAANRFLVEASVAEEFQSRLAERIRSLKVGDGADESILIGPLIDDRAVAKTEELVASAVSDGADILVGGQRIEGAGTFFQPTLIAGAKANSAITREEIFGPVLSVLTFSDEDEAVNLANDTEYGLAAYVFTENVHRVQRLITQLQTGMMGVNTGAISNAAAPFGGTKHSGYGREGGAEGIHEYLSAKYTLLAG